MKKRGISKAFIICAVVACVAAIAVSGYKIVTILQNYKAAEDEYADLQDLMLQGLSPAGTPSAAPTGAIPSADAATAPPTAAPTPTQKAAATPPVSAVAARIAAAAPFAVKIAAPALPATAAPTDAAQPSDAPAGAPDAAAVPTPEPLIQVDFAPFLEINPDTVAWISCADTAINYPVVLGQDNVFYLKHLFSGAWGFSGAIFMDFDNMGDFSDKNTVIYGHHMNDGSMFAGLDDFFDQEYFDLHPTMTLYTPTGDYLLQLFACYNRDASAIPHDFDTPEAFLAYVEELKALSVVAADVEIGPDDRLVTLSTCAYVYDDARLVVIGKLVPLYK